jgi:hypothetical protein
MRDMVGRSIRAIMHRYARITGRIVGLGPRFFFACGLTSLILGCASSPAPVGQERAQRTTQGINLSGFPPEYRQGHTDGCAAVGVTPKPAAKGEGAYLQGWQDGYRYCTRRPPQ